MKIYVDLEERKLIDEDTFNKALHRYAVGEAENGFLLDGFIWDNFGRYDEPYDEDVQESDEYVEYLKEDILERPEYYDFFYQIFEIDA